MLKGRMVDVVVVLEVVLLTMRAWWRLVWCVGEESVDEREGVVGVVRVFVVLVGLLVVQKG